MAIVLIIDGDGIAIPDAPGFYVHKDGTLCQAIQTYTVTPDGVDLAAIVGDLIEAPIATY